MFHLNDLLVRAVIATLLVRLPKTNHPIPMKLVLSTVFATFMLAPFALADCSKCKDKDQDKETTAITCPCEKGSDEGESKDALAEKCKGGTCDDGEATLA